MSAAVPLIAGIGAMGAEEEARSAIATFIAQMITLVRTIITYLMEYVRRIIEWAGEHPLATVLLTTNFIIWIS